MPVLIVDTDILIDIGRGERVAIEELTHAEKQATLAISVITQMELIIGCRDKTELRILDSFLLRFRVVELNSLICRQAVELLRQYRLSHGLLIADAFIAATAITSAHSLMSKNQRDYRFIVGLNLLPYPSSHFSL